MPSRRRTAPPAITDYARRIVVGGPSALTSLPGRKVRRFGKLQSFSREEYDGLKTVKARIAKYLGFADPQRPLSIAVFGPPGSGKSTGVREIFRQLKDASLGWAELNLTQFASTHELARAVAAAVVAVRSTGFSVPF